MLVWEVSEEDFRAERLNTVKNSSGLNQLRAQRYRVSKTFGPNSELLG
jgi:hypothetical protein